MNRLKDFARIYVIYRQCFGPIKAALCGDWHLGNPSRAKQPIKTIDSNHELRNV